ncbi:hypothetical protein DCAR_0310918 [Daucus carota subsp. sativus]|uniref:C2 domain-containing protein n=1 Tax=Daucus carota subsp. sativus TaxID=79200 RepID=A0A166A9T2_DAUCS|nr:PREDICTED: protein SRC2-like [Daucus carota subsp. sativus]WOG91668.1 hypothetical protein DCAR_0310918 [Daucus carota subsp. sativus]
MEYRNFEVTINSARDLEDVRKVFKMEVHARVSIGNHPESEKRTPVGHGGTNPSWNFTINFIISEAMLTSYTSMLVIKLYCSRILGDRYIGEMNLSMKELYEYACPFGGSARVTHPVQKGSVDSQGLLELAYKFGERAVAHNFLMTETIGYGVPCSDTC